jgi:hypothetical protein
VSNNISKRPSRARIRQNPPTLAPVLKVEVAVEATMTRVAKKKADLKSQTDPAA